MIRPIIVTDDQKKTETSVRTFLPAPQNQETVKPYYNGDPIDIDTELLIGGNDEEYSFEFLRNKFPNAAGFATIIKRDRDLNPDKFYGFKCYWNGNYPEEFIDEKNISQARYFVRVLIPKNIATDYLLSSKKESNSIDTSDLQIWRSFHEDELEIHHEVTQHCSDDKPHVTVTSPRDSFDLSKDKKESSKGNGKHRRFPKTSKGDAPFVGFQDFCKYLADEYVGPWSTSADEAIEAIKDRIAFHQKMQGSELNYLLEFFEDLCEIKGISDLIVETEATLDFLIEKFRKRLTTGFIPTTNAKVFLPSNSTAPETLKKDKEAIFYKLNAISEAKINGKQEEDK